VGRKSSNEKLAKWPPDIDEKNLPPKWHSGLHDYHGMKVNISRGIGTSRLTVRLFYRPSSAISLFLY
jgi:predicted MPP superfamily phosphohydrolase